MQQQRSVSRDGCGCRGATRLVINRDIGTESNQPLSMEVVRNEPN